jgi:hypothetical protein
MPYRPAGPAPGRGWSLQGLRPKRRSQRGAGFLKIEKRSEAFSILRVQEYQGLVA